MENYDRNLVREFGRTRTRLLTDGSFSDLLSYDFRQIDKSVVEIARLLEVSRVSVHKWKSGEGYPSVELLADVADFLYPDLSDTVLLQYIRKIQSEKRKVK